VVSIGGAIPAELGFNGLVGRSLRQVPASDFPYSRWGGHLPCSPSYDPSGPSRRGGNWLLDQHLQFSAAATPGPRQGRPEAGDFPVIDEDPGATPARIDERGPAGQFPGFKTRRGAFGPMVADQCAQLGRTQMVQAIVGYFLPR
jgi:hypothetical protein